MTVRLKFLLPIVLVLISFLAAKNVLAALTAHLERDHVTVGESVQLLLELDRQVSVWLDTRPLENDFDILGNISGSRVNIMNGQIDAKTTWTITLAPKRSGKLTIPSLEIDGERSDTLTLLVSDTPIADSKDMNTPIFIETEVDRHMPYVQGMVRYTVRLYYAAKLLEGRLSEPQPDNALVHQIGQDRDYTAERNGQRYRVIERQYAIFPQISGKLVVPAPVLDARIAESSTIRRDRLPDFFGGDPLNNMFKVTRPVRIRGEAEIISVQPRPEEAHGFNWLPAENIELIEDWQPSGGPIHVGEPLKRTVTIRARGLTGEQLPDLDQSAVTGFKVYPDQPLVDTQNLTETIEGEKKQSFALVPTQAGRFKLPAINLHWWDTESHQLRFARLPERMMEILPAVNQLDDKAQLAMQPMQIAEDTVTMMGAESDAPATVSGTILPGQQDNSGAEKVLRAGIWPWLAVLFALLWLATLGIWWRSRLRQTKAKLETIMDVQPQKNGYLARKHFQFACKANNPRLARRHLLEWAALHWPDNPPTGLDTLAERFAEAKIRSALSELDRSLYRGENYAWDGTSLANLISELPRHKRPVNTKTLLPDLYTNKA